MRVSCWKYGHFSGCDSSSLILFSLSSPPLPPPLPLPPSPFPSPPLSPSHSPSPPLPLPLSPPLSPSPSLPPSPPSSPITPRMLGYRTAIDVGYDSVFGSSHGPFWVDNLRCNGSETHIEDCDFPGWGVHNCYFGEAASVVCSSELAPM